MRAWIVQRLHIDKGDNGGASNLMRGAGIPGHYHVTLSARGDFAGLRSTRICHTLRQRRASLGHQRHLVGSTAIDEQAPINKLEDLVLLPQI